MFRVESEKIIYEQEGKMIGFLNFMFLNIKTVNITQIYVKPEYRGKGIAKSLMNYAFDYFEQHNITVKYSCTYIEKNQGKS